MPAIIINIFIFKKDHTTKCLHFKGSMALHNELIFHSTPQNMKYKTDTLQTVYICYIYFYPSYKVGVCDQCYKIHDTEILLISVKEQDNRKISLYFATKKRLGI